MVLVSTWEGSKKIQDKMSASRSTRPKRVKIVEKGQDHVVMSSDKKGQSMDTKNAKKPRGRPPKNKTDKIESENVVEDDDHLPIPDIQKNKRSSDSTAARKYKFLRMNS